MSDANLVKALAEADFSEVASRFTKAGFRVQLPAKGIMQIMSPQAGKRLRLLLSVGVHGDETAPIEVVAHLLQQFSLEPQALQVDLLVAVGNVAAIAQGKRFIEADLNRLFSTKRGDLATVAEAGRADELMQASTAFFADALGEKWHLDLHTAIRKSHYPTFAIVPDVIAPRARQDLIAWLGGAGIGAVILNSKLAPTFSAYTAVAFGAAGTTVELGQIGELGKNDLSQFAVTSAALDAMLRSGDTMAFRRVSPQVFKVAQEIVKRSSDFKLSFDRSTENFSSAEPGAVIATDGEHQYVVGPETEYVVFPNPDVRIGQRAGLMVVRQGH